MTPSQIVAALDTCLNVRRPAFLWGPPGVGKSDLVDQVAKQRGISLIDFRMALRDPTDIKGFPMPDQKTGTMKFFRDAELPVKGKGILFMDELNSAAPATQAAGMQLALYPHRIGDYQLPEGWSIIGAGNREGDRGVVHRMPSPLANRFSHLDYQVNTDDWIRWALAHDISAELIAFIRFRPHLLFTFDPKKADVGHAFASPRSWVAADQLRQAQKDQTVAYELCKGTVGEGPAAEFWAFFKLILELPSVQEINLNPDTASVPKEPASKYAISGALAHATNEKTFARFMQYMKRMDVEFQAMFCRDSLMKTPSLKMDKAFTKWAMDNEKVVM